MQSIMYRYTNIKLTLQKTIIVKKMKLVNYYCFYPSHVHLNNPVAI